MTFEEMLKRNGISMNDIAGMEPGEMPVFDEETEKKIEQAARRLAEEMVSIVSSLSDIDFDKKASQ